MKLRRLSPVLFVFSWVNPLFAQDSAPGDATEAPSAVAPDEQAKEQAISHFQAAVKLVEAGSYEEAAKELERSVALYPSKNALFNLGNSYQALHRYVDALKVFERLDKEFGDSLKPELRLALDKQLTEVRELVVHLRIEVVPHGAQLTLDGKPVSSNDAEVTLDPGTYVVRANLDGYRSSEKSVELGPGDSKAVSLTLEKALALVEIRVNVSGAKIHLDDKMMGTAPLSAPLSLAPGTHKVRVEREGYSPYERTFEAQGEETIRLSINLQSDRPQVIYEPPRLKTGFWVAAGATALSASASAVGFIVAAGKDSKLKGEVSTYEDYPPNTSQVTFDGSLDDIQSLQNQRNTFHTIGWVGGGLAVAGAVTSLALGWSYFFPKMPDDEQAEGTKRHGIVLYPTANGIGGRF